MKIKQLTFGLALAALVGSSVFYSCKKKNTEEQDKDTSSASDQSLASTIVNDMTSISDEAGKSYALSSFKTENTEGLLSASCATLSIDTMAAAKTITVNFGATRKFQLRHIHTKEKLEIELTHGSLLIMQGELQHFWQHQVPKTSQNVLERINLTFRVIK